MRGACLIILWIVTVRLVFYIVLHFAWYCFWACGSLFCSAFLGLKILMYILFSSFGGCLIMHHIIASLSRGTCNLAFRRFLYLPLALYFYFLIIT